MSRPELSPTQKLKSLITCTHHWPMLSEHLAGERDKAVIRLINCGVDDLQQIQGEIKAYQRLIDLKLTLKSEEKARK